MTEQRHPWLCLKPYVQIQPECKKPSSIITDHLQDMEYENNIELMPVDRWIVERCRQTTFESANHLDQYEVGLARHAIDEFFWKDYWDNYLEVVKKRLYKPELHGAVQRASAQQALYYYMLNILKLYAVFVPHITEFIYQEFFRKFEESISLHRLYWEKKRPVDEDIILFGEKIKKVVAGVRRYKSENALSIKAEMHEVTIHAEESRPIGLNSHKMISKHVAELTRSEF